MSNPAIVQAIHNALHAEGNFVPVSTEGMTDVQRTTVTQWHRTLSAIDKLVHQYNYQSENNDNAELSALYTELSTAAQVVEAMGTKDMGAKAVLDALFKQCVAIGDKFKALNTSNDQTRFDTIDGQKVIVHDYKGFIRDEGDTPADAFEKSFGVTLSSEDHAQFNAALAKLIEKIRVGEFDPEKLKGLIIRGGDGELITMQTALERIKEAADL